MFDFQKILKREKIMIRKIILSYFNYLIKNKKNKNQI